MADKRKHSLMPFDTGAWLTDPRVNTLSLMAKGAWVGLLCYMWESSQRGMLVKPNNAPYTLNELVALSGCTDDEPKQADISEKRRNAGKKGGDAMKHRISEAPKKGNKAATPSPIESPPTSKQEQPLLFPNEPSSDDAPPPLTEKQKQMVEKKKKYNYAECVTLTRDEYAKLCAEHGEDATKRMIEILDNYKGSKGKRYKSDYKAILNWVVDRYNEEYIKYGTQRKAASTAQDTGRGIENHTGYASGTIPLDETACGSSDSPTQKGYSERF